MLTSDHPTHQATKKGFNKLHLRTVFVVPFVLQIFTVVGLVGYLSFLNGRKAVDDLANQLMTEIGNRVDQHLNSHLETSMDVGQHFEDALKLGILSLEDIPTVRRFLLKPIQQYPSLTWLYLGTEQPKYIDIQRYEDGSITSADWTVARGADEYSMDDQGNLLELLNSYPDYDYRKRPWYRYYRQAGKPMWHGVYLTQYPPLLVLSSGRPLYGNTGKFLGVISVNFSLSALSDFLNRLPVGKTGQVLILERSGFLVATSTGEQPFQIKQQNGKEEPERIKAIDSQDPFTATVAQYLTQNDYLQAQTELRQTFEVDDIPYFLQVTPYQDQRGIDWLVVVAIPESDFMAQIDHNTRNTIFLSLASLVVAVVLGLLTAHWITRPVNRITQASEAMADGNLDQFVKPNRIIELNTLANSFNSMAGQLKEFLETLEDKVEQRTIELENANQEISILNEKLKAENLRMTAELDVARQIQKMILPKPEELLDAHLDIAGFMYPAEEVGGDYYDVLHHNGRLKIGIGDVTGHGLESGVLMLMTQTAVRTLLEYEETDSTKFLSTLNRVIYDNVQRMNSTRNLSLAILDYQPGCVKLSGQHEEMLVVRANGQVERIDTVDLGFFLGMLPDISEFINHTEVQLFSGDGVVLYTDGITEARNGLQQLYGLERLCQIVSQNWQHSAYEIQQAVVEDVRQHLGTNKSQDDLTLLVLKQR